MQTVNIAISKVQTFRKFIGLRLLLYLGSYDFDFGFNITNGKVVKKSIWPD